VRAWLASLGVPPSVTVLVSWDGSLAVAVPFAVLTQFWDDFFYPVSDVVVIPLTLACVLIWFHWELLVIGCTVPSPGLG
jgi:hypothetical protein